MKIKFEDLKLLLMIVILLIMNSKIMSSQELIASTNEIQSVYQNIWNPIRTNLNCYNYRVEIVTNNGVIESIDNQFYWRPETKGITFLKLISYETEKPIDLDSIKFQVVSYGMPRIRLNKKMWHSGAGDYYRSTKFIFELNKKDEYLKLEDKIKIKSFEMYVSLEKVDGEIESYKFISNNKKLPKEFETIKNKLKKGDTLKIILKKVEIICDWIEEVKYYDEYLEGIPEHSLKWTWLIR